MKTVANLLPALLLLVIGLLWPMGELVLQTFVGVDDLTPLLHSPWIRDALGFTLWQATLSTLLSVGLALPLALLMAGRRWPGRSLLLALSTLPFALPSVLVAFAFVLAFGRSGLVNHLLRSDIALLYNPFAVVAAHLFFNLPFALRHLLDAVETIPLEQRRSAELLRLGALTRTRVVIWPHIRGTVATLLLLILILCLSSFAVVLILGGGPQATTLEVAIYQLLRFDANTSGAALLALGQLILLLPAVFLYRHLARSTPSRQQGTGGKRLPPLPMNALPFGFRATGLIALSLYGLFLTLPLAALLLDGLRDAPRSITTLTSETTATALGNSFALALPAALVGTLVSWLFARGIAALERHRPTLAATIGDSIWFLMGVSPTVLTLGWILLLTRHEYDPFNHPYLPILLVHTLLALPLSIRILLPHLRRIETTFDRSALSLGLGPLLRMRFVEWPELRRPLLSALLVAFAFSFGDVSCILMFGGGTYTTLPMHIFELMGAYRFGAAALASIALAALCVGFFWLSELRASPEERKP